jgi:hypothetical protein
MPCSFVLIKGERGKRKIHCIEESGQPKSSNCEPAKISDCRHPMSSSNNSWDTVPQWTRQSEELEKWLREMLPPNAFTPNLVQPANPPAQNSEQQSKSFTPTVAALQSSAVPLVPTTAISQIIFPVPERKMSTAPPRNIPPVQRTSTTQRDRGTPITGPQSRKISDAGMTSISCAKLSPACRLPPVAQTQPIIQTLPSDGKKSSNDAKKSDNSMAGSANDRASVAINGAKLSSAMIAEVAKGDEIATKLPPGADPEKSAAKTSESYEAEIVAEKGIIRREVLERGGMVGGADATATFDSKSNEFHASCTICLRPQYFKTRSDLEDHLIRAGHDAGESILLARATKRVQDKRSFGGVDQARGDPLSSGLPQTVNVTSAAERTRNAARIIPVSNNVQRIEYPRAPVSLLAHIDDRSTCQSPSVHRREHGPSSISSVIPKIIDGTKMTKAKTSAGSAPPRSEGKISTAPNEMSNSEMSSAATLQRQPELNTAKQMSESKTSTSSIPVFKQETTTTRAKSPRSEHGTGNNVDPEAPPPPDKKTRAQQPVYKFPPDWKLANTPGRFGFDKRLESRPDLLRQFDRNANKIIDPENLLLGSSHVDYQWICLSHLTCKKHVWFASINLRARGSGCRFCSKPPKGYCGCDGNLLSQSPLASEIDVQKNLVDNIVTEGLPITSHTQIWWKCDKGHPSWKVAVYCRGQDGTGCRKCARYKRYPLKLLKDHAAPVYAQAEPELNPGKNLETIELTSKESLNFRCRKHGKCLLHIWSTIVICRTKATKPTGCPYCVGLKVCKVCNPEKFLGSRTDLLAEWDHEYDANKKVSDPSSLLLSSAALYQWICQKHKTCKEHIWITSLHTRFYYDSGCPNCSNPRQKWCECEKDHMLPNQSHLVPEIDVEKNAKDGIDINLPIGSPKKIHWKCKVCAHQWPAKVWDRAHLGTGCPPCAELAIIPRMERDTLEILTELHIANFIPGKKFAKCRNKRVLKWDNFIPELGGFGALIETDGPQHFGPWTRHHEEERTRKFKDSQICDRIKNRFVEAEPYHFLRIAWSLRGQVKQIVAKFIADLVSHTELTPLIRFEGKEYQTEEYIKNVR